MFVPAPPRNTNGTTQEHVTVSRAVVSTLRTVADAHAVKGTTTHNSQSISGVRTRTKMQNGIIDYNVYRPTPYGSLAVRFKPYGSSSVVSWNGYNGNSARYACTEIRGAGAGYLGGHATGVGTPWRQFDWMSSTGNVTHTSNRSAILNMRNRIENEAKLKAADMKMDLSESLVDIGPTVKLVARRASQLARIVLAVRKGDLKSVRTELKIDRRISSRTPAELWLELQYGWRPLISDIQSGVDLVNRGLARPDGVVTVTRRGSQSLEIDDYFDSSDNIANPSVEGSANADVECKLRFRVSNPNLAYLTSLGISNPLYAAWVSIPLSFVVDWLVPVGDWLNGMTSTLGLTFVNGYTTVKSSSNYFATCQRWTGTYRYPIERSGRFGYSLQSCQIERYVHETWPSSRLYYRFPFSSSQRIASAVALLQLLSTR